MGRRIHFDVTGMEHRAPERACPLCPVWGVPYDPEDRRSWGRQHEHAAALWESFDGTAGSVPEVVEACRRLGLVAPTRQQVLRHFRHHLVEQPAPPGTLRRQEMLALVERLVPRLQAVIDLIYRVRLVSGDQVADLLYRGPDGAPDSRRARRDLEALAREHLIYRYYPAKPFEGWSAKEPLWLLGRNSLPWLEVRYPKRASGEHYVTMARQVGRNSLFHDWRANDLCLEIGRQAQASAHPLAEGQAAVRFATSNWWGPRHLVLGFHDRTNAREREVIPDGFISLAVTAPAGATTLPASWQLPMFVEFDRGSRPLGEVVDQLLAYHWLALSGAAGRRFPQLAIPGYAVPVLMIFRLPDRVREGRRRLLERAAELGLTDGTPILLVSERDLLEGLFEAERITYAWDRNQDRRWPLLRILQQTARPLVESRRLTGQATLRIEPDGARREARRVMPRPRRQLEAARRRLALDPVKTEGQPAASPSRSADGAPGRGPAPSP